MTPLNSDLRSSFEDAIKKARTAAEQGARQVLESLAIGLRDPFETMDPDQRSLRRRLRAHGRQLGDIRRKDGTQAINRLVREVAYEHWHRMLFARFLAENHLLIEPDSGVPIPLEECVDLARERGEDPWALAASFAQRMLPQIFRVGDPALDVILPPETRQALQSLLAGLPKAVFLEDDSLGWTYQFWQSAEKEAVNARVRSEEKISGETLPAVTQLFTEPYMVKFLLHNTLGAWHAGKVLSESQREEAASEQHLRDAVRLTPKSGYDFEYLRFVRAGAEGDQTGPWRPAAGTFQSWPTAASELTVLDPCCGSGHFLVEAFYLLVSLRSSEEGLGLREAIDAVISENLFGLELDPRCTQIAAFNLALAAWKLIGTPTDLPPIRIACSGIGPEASKEKWLALAEEAAAAEGMPGKRDLFGSEDTLLSAGVKEGLEALYDLFRRAPLLGSLIDPAGVSGNGTQVDAFRVGFETLKPSLDAILRREGVGEENLERAVAAKGMAEAARILLGPRGGYTLVATNVPYLLRAKQSKDLRNLCEGYHKAGAGDLATVFLERCRKFCGRNGVHATVTPQNWLYLVSYSAFRRLLLTEQNLLHVTQIGSGATATASWDVLRSLAIVGASPSDRGSITGIEVTDPTESERAAAVRQASLFTATSSSLLKNPDFRIALSPAGAGHLLMEYAESLQGTSTGDTARFVAKFWELPLPLESWEFWQSTVATSQLFGGRHHVVFWEGGEGALASSPSSAIRGLSAKGRFGVSVTQMRELPCTLFEGTLFDTNAAALVPRNPEDLTAIWCFCSSPEFQEAVRRIDKKLGVTNASLAKIPFDLPSWKRVAKERYPEGIPRPFSDGPAQWVFHGHPASAEPGTELQVALAHLLGYRWPAERDPDMSLSKRARRFVEGSKALHAKGFADSDGIVCLSSIRGEASAADRLRTLLAVAFGTEWSPSKERELLAAAAESGHGSGKRASSLEEWLRTSFFEEHCKLFHHRPFIWHLWDGLKDGFNALGNYHQLAGPDGAGRRTLDSLTFSYLGEWIDRQRAAQQSGQEGADARLAAAVHLQGELTKILEGEPPYDLFVRWKPLHEQPIGWDPDINDGVRLNIRPFLVAEDVGRKGAGILRFKPNVKWKKDRGKEPESLRPREDFPWFWGCDPENHHEHRVDFGAGTVGSEAAGEEFDGARWNDLHYTRTAKEAARSRTRGEADG
jgi:hypothetical protein